jgi:hypothetical protein
LDFGHPVVVGHGGGSGSPTMRLNIWVVLAILIVLFAVTRYMRHQQTPDICLDDPTASVCEREIVKTRTPPIVPKEARGLASPR